MAAYAFHQTNPDTPALETKAAGTRPGRLGLAAPEPGP